MEYNIKIKLADENTFIPERHRCHNCKYVILEAFKCENDCTAYCKEHQPQNTKCDMCDGQLEYDKRLTENIKKRYKIKCPSCPVEMMLQDFDSHLKSGCKEECPNKCGESFDSPIELQTHLKKECINSIIFCIGCKQYTDQRGMVEIHQQTCEQAEQFFDVIIFFFFFFFFIFIFFYLLRVKNFFFLIYVFQNNFIFKISD